MSDDQGALEARLDAAAIVGRGAEAEVYDWGPGRVLRLFNADVSARRDPALEATVMRSVAEAGVPVPMVYESVTIGDRVGLVMDRVDGPSMLAPLTRAPWRTGATARRFGELHASIVARPAPAGLAPVHEEVADALGRLERDDQWLAPWAEHELAELPRGSVLLHGDFHPDNVLLGPDGPVVIDWTGARSGPLEADIARTLVLLEGSTPPNASFVERALIGLLRNRVFLPGYRRGLRRRLDLDLLLIRRWRMVRIIERLAEGPPEERPTLRKLIRESGGPRDF